MAKQKERDYAGKLYDTFHEQMEGFTKSETEFREALKSPDYQKKVYRTLSEQMEGFTRTEPEFYGLLKKKENTIVPSASSGMANSTGGKNKLPVGVASQQLLSSYGVKPVSSKTTAKDVYKGVVDEAKNQAAPKAKAPVVSRNSVDEDGKYWERTKSTLSTLGKSIIDGVAATSSEQIAIMAKTIDDEVRDFVGAKPLNKRIEDYQTYKWAQDIKGATQEAFQPNAEFKGEIQEQVAQTTGDLLGLVATALITKNPSSAIAKLGTKGIVRGLANSATRRAITREIAKDSIKMLAKPTTFVATAQTGTRNYDEAKAKGATDDEANAMFWSTAITGGLANSLPVGSLLNRFDVASGGKMKNVVIGGVAGGIEEAITEGIEQISTNFAAKNIYDETRNLFEGFGESVSMGGGIGFVLNAMGVKLGSIRNKYKDNPQKLAEIDNSIQYIKEIAEKEGQGSAMKLSKEERVQVDKYNSILNNPESSSEEIDVANEKIQEITGQKIVDAENIAKIVSTLPEDAQIDIKIIDAEIDRLSEAAAKSNNVEIKDSLVSKMSELIDQKNEIITIGKPLSKQQEQAVDYDSYVADVLDGQSSSVSEIESRMDSAELIDEGDINKATDDLYSLHDQVSSEEKDGPEKEGLLLAIENKIKKLEGYEFETTSEVIEPGQTKAVSRGVKIIGTTTRGSKSKNTVTGERLDKKSVTVNNEKTGDVIDGELVFSDGKLDILDPKTGKSSVFDTGKLEYVETGLDDSGVVSSITLKDNTTGDSFTINDPDIAIDLSIQEKIKQLGEINDGILEEVMQEVEVAPVVKTKVKEKATIPNPNPSVLPNIPISPQASTQAQPTSPSTPKNGKNITTPEEAAKLSEEMVEEESLAVRGFNEKMKKARKWLTAKKWVDRQSGIRKELNRAGAKVTEAFMTNVAGARAFADKRFESVEKKIYDKMDLNDEKVFDQLAFHNRVIQIDENFDSRRLDAEIKIDELQKKLEAEKARLKSLGKRPTLKDLKESTKLSKQIKQQKDNLKDKPLHPKGFNMETSRLAIQGIRDKVGEKFDDLNAKLGDFFGEFNKLLEEQYNAGLLNKETYDRFKEDKYIPRRFLSHLLIEPGTKNISPIAEKSLTKDQIKAIEGGSESLLFTDTRVLLNAAMRSSASRIAQNYANRALAETVNKLGKDNNIGKAANYSLDKGGIKTDAFGNRVVREADPGYTNIFFFNEGKRDAVQVKNGMAKEFLDAEKKFDDFDPLLKTVLLNGVLKNLATGINATFFISNVPVDFVNVVLFTSTYDDTNIFNASRKLSKSFAQNARDYTMMESGAKVDPEFEKTYQEWVENGGMMQFLTDQGRPDEVANRDSEIRNKKSLAPLNKVKKKVVGTLAFTGEVSEKAMRLSVFQKVKSDMIKDAGGRDNLSERQYKELLAVAASASRKTMDFAQGGLFGKKADVFLPYLNASIQGLRVSVEYVASNPKKFIGKLAQASVPIAALMFYNIMVMDDPEEWQNVPTKEKENYFIIFKPWKNDEGKREYLRIKKHPSIQWFTNAIESAVIKTHDLLVDDKLKINKGDSFIESEWSALNNALPIPLSFKKAFSKSPAAVQAGIAYVANFDLFKDEKISKDFGEVTPVLEGMYDKQVPLFYKEFAKATGASPKRTQAAVEKVVTNPGTNAIVGLSYSLLDNMVTGMTGNPKIGTESKYQDTSPSGVANLFSARLVREIDPNYSKFKDTRAKDLAMELKSKDKEIKSDIKAILKAKGNGPSLLGDAKSYVDKLDISKEEKPRLKKYAEDQFKLKTALGSTPNAEFYLDLKYERDPRLKAFLFFDKYGVVDAEAKAEATRNANRLGYKLFGNDRFDAEYKKLINEQKALGKNK